MQQVRDNFDLSSSDTIYVYDKTGSMVTVHDIHFLLYNPGVTQGTHTNLFYISLISKKAKQD